MNDRLLSKCAYNEEDLPGSMRFQFSSMQRRRSVLSTSTWINEDYGLELPGTGQTPSSS